MTKIYGLLQLINYYVLLYNCAISINIYFPVNKLKQYLQLHITDTALKVSRSLYCFTTSVSHGVEKYFPRLWGMGISDAIFLFKRAAVYGNTSPTL